MPPKTVVTLTEPAEYRPTTAAQRWLARLALVSAIAAALVLIAGGFSSVVVVLSGVGAIAVSLAGFWWFLSHRRTLRWIGAVLCVTAPSLAIVFYLSRHLLWAILLAIALSITAAASARAALKRARPPRRMPEYDVPPPRRPFLVMNPHSGGGKVRSDRLDTKAALLGAEVVLLGAPGEVDVVTRSRQAVTGGADLLGVAGGDGTQAMVAGLAAEHDLPFLVVSAGTRNHFAMDLGLDRAHPGAALSALRRGVELHVDLGNVNGRSFVNNVSFGAYAEVVKSPSYREDKWGTTLELLPDLLSGHRGPRLVARIDGQARIDAPQALLVSNNPYGLGDIAGLGRRARLDTGALGVVAVRVDNAGQAVRLLRGQRASGLRRTLAREVVVEADADEIPVGIDGEAVMMPTPVRCTILPLALRVRVPQSRPGTPVASVRLDPALLFHQAFSTVRLTHAGEAGQRS